MLERLGAAVAELEVPVHGDTIAELLGLIDRLQAKAAAAIGAYDASGLWEVEGATSTTAWLRQRSGMTAKHAAATVRTARRLRELPITAAAWLEGGFSGGQVQAVTANVDDRTVGLFADHESGLVPTLAPLSTDDTMRAMRLWRARAEALLVDEEQSVPHRSLHLSQTLDGRWALDGDLDPEGGSVVETALRLAGTDEAEGEALRLPSRRRADALVDLARFYLDHQDHLPAGRHRPHLNVVVSWDDLVAGRGGELVDGGFLDGASIRRLLCDSAVNRVVTEGRSSILDYGTSTRTVPAGLWAALVLRDRHCRHDGCDRPPHWCEAHHVTPVLDGGPTSLDNLVLKCSRHHHLGHLPGRHEKLLPDGTLVSTDPGGRTRTTKPPGVVATLIAA